jgi:hypothetical protein
MWHSRMFCYVHAQSWIPLYCTQESLTGVTSSKAMTVAIPSRASTTGSQALSCHRDLWRAGTQVCVFEFVFVSSSVKVSLENLCHLMSQCVSVTWNFFFVFICLCLYVHTYKWNHTLRGVCIELEDTPCLCMCLCLIECVRVLMFGVYLFGFMCVITNVFCAVLRQIVSNYRHLSVAFVLSLIMTLPHTCEHYYYCNASTHCCCCNDCCAATDAAATAATHTHTYTHTHTHTHNVQIPARASTAEVPSTSISQYKLGTKLVVN